MNISILGAGAWGTALAQRCAGRHGTLLWARDPDQAAAMQRQRCNARYLDGVTFHDDLVVTADRDDAIAHAREGLVIVASPMAGLAGLLAVLPPASRVMWLCKGFEAGTGRLGHEIARDVLPQASVGVLSGPSFAIEVARGQPTALVAASADPDLAEITVDALHGDSLRVYTNNDPIGVEVGGALKNVMAIATGMCDGLDLGLNARAALITRGLAEITRLGIALGARAETFMGLSGLGDLVLTCTGDLSRNRQVGLRLARGQTLAEALAALGHVAEGVPTAATALARARRAGVEMPITEAVCDVLDSRCSPQQAVARLMVRGARAEG